MTATNTLTTEEQEEETAYHCFRGRLTPETLIYLSEAPAAASEGAGAAEGEEEGEEEEEEEEEEGSEASSEEEEEAGGHSAPAAAAGVGDVQRRQQRRRLCAQTRVAQGSRVRLVGQQLREARAPPTNVVHVHTNDGEW